MMAPRSVADAGALIAYLRSEPGYEVFGAAMGLPGVTCYAHAANRAEVFYDSMRRGGEVRAQELLGDLVTGDRLPEGHGRQVLAGTRRGSRPTIAASPSPTASASPSPAG